MEKNFRKSERFRLINILTLIIITAGIALRLVAWFRGRDLMMDEINVVRNIYERSFTGLFLPLDYQQYAPPLFLWALKLSTVLFGFGERAVRLFPILCSIASVWVLYKLLIKMECRRSVWYPVALFCFGYIYIMYGNDVKQYSSDVLVTLSLIMLTFYADFSEAKRMKSALWLGLSGAVAIWLSMPSVFILAGIGIALFLKLALEKKRNALLWLIVAGVLWLLSFILYYHFLLDGQIGSKSLQDFHAPYVLLPENNLVNEQNRRLLKDLLEQAVNSDTDLGFWGNLLLAVIGLVRLFRKNWPLALMIFLPIVFMMVAALLKEFTLIPRVSLFAMPLFLLLVGAGLETLLRIPLVWLSVPIAAVMVVAAWESADFKLYREKIETDEFTKCVQFATDHHTAYEDIYIPTLYGAVYDYYVNVHPDKQRAQLYSKIKMIKYDENWDSLSNSIHHRSAFIYFWIDDDVMYRHRTLIFSKLAPLDSMVKPSYKVLVFDTLKK